MVQFSHIYIENSIQSHPFTQEIISSFPHAQTVPIDHYKEFFNRPNQNFLAQRKGLKLILAKQEEHFFHQGTNRIRSFGDPHIFSGSMIRNCMYHCEYCFLSGMHESANIVVYVNIEDFEKELNTIIRTLQPDPIYLVSSYLSDLPAYEQYIPLCKKWMHITKTMDNVELEIRTKSDAYRILQQYTPQTNTILTWSLSPEPIVKRYEHGTASLATRILQASQAIQDGWRVRLCFDPILYYKGWEKDYQQCIDKTFTRCNADHIEKVSYGVFRMSSSYLQNMKRLLPSSHVLHHAIHTEQGLASYSSDVIDSIQQRVAHMLEAYIPKERMTFVHG